MEFGGAEEGKLDLKSVMVGRVVFARVIWGWGFDLKSVGLIGLHSRGFCGGEGWVRLWELYQWKRGFSNELVLVFTISWFQLLHLNFVYSL